MKTTKKTLKVLLALLINTIVGIVLAGLFGLPTAVGVIGVNVLGFVMPRIMPAVPGLCAGLHVQVWEDRVLEKLTTADQGGWLEGIEDKSSKVTGTENAQVINMIDFGVEPDVLVDNLDYPIPSQELGATAIPITLNKYQTKVTPVTDDELQGLAFAKIDEVTKAHRMALTKSKYKRSIYNIAPAVDSDKTPVLVTTGADDGMGRKRLTFEDIVALKAKFDAIEVPEEGRRLVLCTDHANDILLFDNVFKEKYSNEQTGKIMNLAGFDIYTYVANPYYTASTKVRKAFGAVPDAGDYKASVAFYAPRVVKAAGLLKMYRANAETDPENQTTRINFRHYFIAMPKKQEAIGAIVSAAV